jgi:hypothetical protein
MHGWRRDVAHTPPHDRKPTQTSKLTRVIRSGGAKANKWMHMEGNAVGGASVGGCGVPLSLLFSFKVSRVLSCLIL